MSVNSRITALRQTLLPRRVLIALGLSALALPAWTHSPRMIRGAKPLRRLPPGANLATELRTSASAVARTWIETHPPERLGWSWGEGVLAFGIERAQAALSDRALLNYSRGYLTHHLTRGIALHSSDDTTPGLAAIERVLAGDLQFASLATKIAEYQLRAPRSPSGLILHLGDAFPRLVRSALPDAWVDSLFHVVPMLLRYSVYSGETRFRDEGARQLSEFARVLTDPASGLVTHAYDDSADGAGEPVPPFAHRAFWARGNGWMLATLIDAMEHLPRDHANRAELLSYAQRLAQALGRQQRPTGLFGTLLQDADSYEETAGSALILYAMARGIRLGVLPNEMRGNVERGGRGLWSVILHRGREALVTGTSLGTNPVEALYARTPTAAQVSYGVGAWLLAAVEIADALEEVRLASHVTPGS